MKDLFDKPIKNIAARDLETGDYIHKPSWVMGMVKEVRLGAQDLQVFREGIEDTKVILPQTLLLVTKGSKN